MKQWQELEVSISQVEALLETHHVEVLSPDGYVQVTDYINKGIHDEYVVVLDNDYTLRCSSGHRFETDAGWLTTQELLYNSTAKVLVDTGEFISTKSVTFSGNKVPIVDITVDHENHRYYTAGISSHNTGKSLALCHFAASSVRQGKNALYITLEMAEERIAERVDCNLLDVSMDDLYRLKKDDYVDRVKDIETATHGKFVVKEYPTASAHAGHFKSLLNELQLKKNFVPDIIYIDYLNICTSQRLKGNANANSYTVVKSIAEELRGLAVEFNVPIVTATQFTRSASTDTDSDMTGIAESFGTAASMDMIFAIMRTEELDEMGQLMIKQLKSRFNDVNYYKKFIVGVDISKFRLYNADMEATKSLSEHGRTDDDTPVFDKSTFGKRLKSDYGSAEIDFS